MYYESMEVNGKKYELCDTDTTDGWFTGAVIEDYGKGEDGCVRKIYEIFRTIPQKSPSPLPLNKRFADFT
ncbi:hypothetical protein PZH37_19055, partial [[Eubacterium] siraeum]|nr:hypothetical protein [[Eubacterium] siraeum]